MLDRKERGNGCDKAQTGFGYAVCGFHFNPSAPCLRCCRHSRSVASLIFGLISHRVSQAGESCDSAACQLLGTFDRFLRPCQNALLCALPPAPARQRERPGSRARFGREPRGTLTCQPCHGDVWWPSAACSLKGSFQIEERRTGRRGEERERASPRIRASCGAGRGRMRTHSKWKFLPGNCRTAVR